MKDLIFVRNEFAHNVFFNPNTGENENISKTADTATVFAEDGEVVAECGETYHSPMWANNTQRIERFQVKAGACDCGFQYKRLISEPAKIKVGLVF